MDAKLTKVIIKQETQVILFKQMFLSIWVHYDQNRQFYREGSILLSFNKCKYSSSSVLKQTQTTKQRI